MNYSQTVDYLYHKLPMFSRSGARALKKDLSRTWALCNYLGHPEKRLKTIHVAGTNGKGSVCNMLAAIFQEHGFKTGLFTSPHIRDYRERIRINGQLISEDFVVQFVQRTMELNDTIKPSFFELTFGMAMEYFAAEKVDIAVIETGLGGRLDSTNVVIPELSVITNIGYDHMDILGDTLEKIAGEKAGIFKDNIPVVIGETHPETRQVFIDNAARHHSTICFADQHFSLKGNFVEDGHLFVRVHEKETIYTETYELDLIGNYQRQNLITVLQAIALLKDKFSLKFGKVVKALSAVRELTGFEGRWQIIHRHPYIVVDVGHNVDGVKQIVQHLSHLHYKTLHIITGMVKDKDVIGVLKLWPENARYYFTNAHMSRAMPAGLLRQKAMEAGRTGGVYDNVNDAVQAACKLAEQEDLILVAGSFFIIGELDATRWQPKSTV